VVDLCEYTQNHEILMHLSRSDCAHRTQSIKTTVVNVKMKMVVDDEKEKVTKT